MQFASPYLLALLILVPLVVLWQRRRPTPANPLRLGSLAWLRTIPPDRRVTYRWLPTALRLLAVALLIAGLARPQKGRAGAEIPAEGIDIVMALDISGSMADTYVGGESKLAIAKRVAAEFIEGRDNDRIGLVVFQKESLALSPLTLDYQPLLKLLQAVRTGLLPEGTAVGMAVADSLNLLQESQAKSRVIILLTDGENNELLVPPLEAAHLARAVNVRVYTIGFLGSGVAGAGPRSSFARRVEDGLKEIAQVADAQYFRATDPASLRSVYDEIGRLEKSRVERKGFIAFDEMVVYFVLPALGLLLLEAALRGTVFRRVP